MAQTRGPKRRGRTLANATLFMEARRSICDEFYSKSPDPWGFRTSWYEQRKREIVVASLPRRRFGSCWELGCSGLS